MYVGTSNRVVLSLSLLFPFCRRRLMELSMDLSEVKQVSGSQQDEHCNPVSTQCVYAYAHIHVCIFNVWFSDVV